jgi:hypothetical protein
MSIVAGAGAAVLRPEGIKSLVSAAVPSHFHIAASNNGWTVAVILMVVLAAVTWPLVKTRLPDNVVSGIAAGATAACVIFGVLALL